MANSHSNELFGEREFGWVSDLEPLDDLVDQAHGNFDGRVKRWSRVAPLFQTFLKPLLIAQVVPLYIIISRRDTWCVKIDLGLYGDMSQFFLWLSQELILSSRNWAKHQLSFENRNSSWAEGIQIFFRPAHHKCTYSEAKISAKASGLKWMRDAYSSFVMHKCLSPTMRVCWEHKRRANQMDKTLA